jgi:hypothetical protein
MFQIGCQEKKFYDGSVSLSGTFIFGFLLKVCIDEPRQKDYCRMVYVRSLFFDNLLPNRRASFVTIFVSHRAKGLNWHIIILLDRNTAAKIDLLCFVVLSKVHTLP